MFVLNYNRESVDKINRECISLWHSATRFVAVCEVGTLFSPPLRKRRKQRFPRELSGCDSAVHQRHGGAAMFSPMALLREPRSSRPGYNPKCQSSV